MLASSGREGGCARSNSRAGRCQASHLSEAAAEAPSGERIAIAHVVLWPWTQLLKPIHLHLWSGHPCSAEKNGSCLCRNGPGRSPATGGAGTPSRHRRHAQSCTARPAGSSAPPAGSPHSLLSLPSPHAPSSPPCAACPLRKSIVRRQASQGAAAPAPPPPPAQPQHEFAPQHQSAPQAVQGAKQPRKMSYGNQPVFLGIFFLAAALLAGWLFGVAGSGGYLLAAAACFLLFMWVVPRPLGGPCCCPHVQARAVLPWQTVSLPALSLSPGPSRVVVPSAPGSGECRACWQLSSTRRLRCRLGGCRGCLYPGASMSRVCLLACSPTPAALLAAPSPGLQCSHRHPRLGRAAPPAPRHAVTAARGAATPLGAAACPSCPSAAACLSLPSAPSMQWRSWLHTPNHRL